MSSLLEGSKVKIESYKHDGKLHRVWEKNIVLSHKDGDLITVNDKVKVLESNGSSWRTKEPAISFFSKTHWFNIVAIFRPAGIYYYCNIASPIRLNDGVLQYIDYDLDIEVTENKIKRLLDKEEYQTNSQQMNYPHEITQQIKEELAVLTGWIDRKRGLFNEEFVSKWYQRYQQMDVKWDEV
ncbi:MAG: DUF402 domain-containing protein [Tuberibacillus sp.]